jgi:hypothetical protein
MSGPSYSLLLTDFRSIDAKTLPPRVKRDEVREARGWLMDCFGDEPEAVEVISLANAILIIQLIDKHYVGGWKDFVNAVA